MQTLGDTLHDPSASEAASRAVFDAADRSEHLTVRYGPTSPNAVRCGASYNLAAVSLYRSVPKALSWQTEALHRAELEGDRRIIAVNAARLSLVHRPLHTIHAVASLADLYTDLGRLDDADAVLEQATASGAGALADASHRPAWRSGGHASRAFNAAGTTPAITSARAPPPYPATPFLPSASCGSSSRRGWPMPPADTTQHAGSWRPGPDPGPDRRAPHPTPWEERRRQSRQLATGDA